MTRDLRDDPALRDARDPLLPTFGLRVLGPFELNVDYLSQIRRALPPGRLVTERGGYRLVVDAEELDARRFARLLADGSRALAEGADRVAESRLAGRARPLARRAVDRARRRSSGAGRMTSR